MKEGSKDSWVDLAATLREGVREGQGSAQR